MTHLASRQALRPGQIHRPRAASLPTLARIHTEGYLESLQEPAAMLPILGFELDDARQDAFLDAQRLAVGGTLLATRLARTRGLAINLGGGFHHALADGGHGFCVFNDVAVAIADCRQRGFVEPVLVIDLDLHDGDGTRTLFAADRGVHTFSIHNRDLGRSEAVESTSIALGDRVADARYLAALRETLPTVFERFAPGLVFYLAGCDVAGDDALGNWNVSGGALLERDRFVLELARREVDPVPTVVLLAGGYGQAAWRHSARSLAWLFRGPGEPEPPRTLELTLAAYRRAAQRLSTPELTVEPVTERWTLTEDDLLPGRAPRHTRLLGFYSRHGMELALERYGLFEQLRAQGFEGLRLEFDLETRPGESVRLTAAGLRDEPLIELRVRRDTTSRPGSELLFVEWLRLQDPRARFSAERPQLPEQHHPGLGLLREVASLLVLACERLGLDGLALVPAHYHVAALSGSPFRFADPVIEARFRALRAAVGRTRLADVARAFEEGRIVDRRSGLAVAWEPRLMILAVSDKLKAELLGERYEAAVTAAARRFDFVVHSRLD